MEEVSTIGLDIAKSVFQAHGADAEGRQLFSRRLTRSKVLEFLAAQPPCLVAMEACGGAHHWARELSRFGHEVRLIPPAYVKPYVKRQKNDAADADPIRLIVPMLERFIATDRGFAKSRRGASRAGAMERA